MRRGHPKNAESSLRGAFCDPGFGTGVNNFEACFGSGSVLLERITPPPLFGCGPLRFRIVVFCTCDI